MDANLLSMSLIELEDSNRSELIGGLADGLQAMIKEVVELRKENFTDVDVTNAKDVLIKTAKSLNKAGIISLEQKEFGVNEDGMEQDEIDALFRDL